MPNASASAAATPPLSPEEFCSQAVALGEKNYAGAAPSERANVPTGHHFYVKDLASAPLECSMRVKSPNVEFHPEAARACLDAAAKVQGAQFFKFSGIPECDGVVSGKAPKGTRMKFSEECGTGLSLVAGVCVEPVVEHAECDELPGGYLGDPKQHPQCKEGLACIQLTFGADGNPLVFKCLEPVDIGERCKIELAQCVPGASCYQGKCRALAEEGGVCMGDRDCGSGLGCELPGGVFGKCVQRKK
jgi:hypothetical protein